MLMKYFLAWFPMTVIAIANGAMRELLYKESLGEMAAHRLSTASLIFLFGIYVFIIMRIWRLQSSRHAIFIGCMWFAMTVAFEFGFGHYVAGNPWSRLLANYNILAGRVWLLVLIWILTLPYIIYRVMGENPSEPEKNLF